MIVSELMSKLTPTVYERIKFSKMFEPVYFKHKGKYYIAEAESEIKKKVMGGGTDNLLNDYVDAYHKHSVSWNEYIDQYDFPSLSESEREEFISRARMNWYEHRINRNGGYFWDKTLFLNTFSQYVKRKWLHVTERTPEKEVSDFLNQYNCIVKPVESTCGIGIERVEKGSMTYSQFVEKYLKSGEILIEEQILNYWELSGFYPNSLNTIRVVTFSNDIEAMVFGAFFRCGSSSIVDNCHAGGMFAQIDVDSGLIISDAINVSGGRFKKHPVTEKDFKGFQIPHWDEIKEMCIEACKVIPSVHIVGWDVALNENEEIQFVEGNHCPDFDVMQSPLRKGVKKNVISVMEKMRLI